MEYNTSLKLLIVWLGMSSLQWLGRKSQFMRHFQGGETRVEQCEPRMKWLAEVQQLAKKLFESCGVELRYGCARSQPQTKGQQCFAEAGRGGYGIEGTVQVESGLVDVDSGIKSGSGGGPSMKSPSGGEPGMKSRSCGEPAKSRLGGVRSTRSRSGEVDLAMSHEKLIAMHEKSILW